MASGGMHMLIHEAGQAAGLTRKAIEYYVSQGLLDPAVQDNGYRNFSDADVARLRRIALLRRLGLTVAQLRDALADNCALQDAAVRAELDLRRSQQRLKLLERLSGGEDEAVIRRALDMLDAQRSVADCLLDAFPGYYGHFLALHFASFLDLSIDTDEQRAAYADMLAWLDAAPPLPEEIRRWLDEATSGFTPAQMKHLSQRMRETVADPQLFAAQYEQVRGHMDALQATPAAEYTRALKEFFQCSGYYDRFLPALRRLSPAYAEYSAQLTALESYIRP